VSSFKADPEYGCSKRDAWNWPLRTPHQSGVAAKATLDNQAEAPLTVFGQTLHMDDNNRICLTDLWKAAGRGSV